MPFPAVAPRSPARSPNTFRPGQPFRGIRHRREYAVQLGWIDLPIPGLGSGRPQDRGLLTVHRCELGRMADHVKAPADRAGNSRSASRSQ